MMQLKRYFDRLETVEDKAAEAVKIIDEKEAEVENLKKEAKQKAQNELDLLKVEFAQYL